MAAIRAKAALFLLVGLGFLAFWIRQESGRWTPLPNEHWMVVASFSALLAGLGASLLVWSGHQGAVRLGRWPAGGALAASIINLLEDGFGLDWAFFVFIAATFTLLVGQVALATRSKRNRAAVPALSALALALYPVAGGPLMALAWGTAAWQTGRVRH